MAIAGELEARKDHAEAAARFALEAMNPTLTLPKGEGTESSSPLGRDGVRFMCWIDCGPVVAGVIGEKKLIYDLWGDAVNTASRMDEYSEPGQIQVTEQFKERLIAHHNPPLDKLRKWEVFSLTERGEVEIKGKGLIRTWFFEKKLSLKQLQAISSFFKFKL